MNPHVSRQGILSPSCIPVPPHKRIKRIDRTRTGYPTVNMPCRKLSRKAVVSMVLFTPYALPMSYYPSQFWSKDRGMYPLAAFIGGFCYPTKGCAGIEPATTQRVSPRLLPSALVYTTEFHPIEQISIWLNSRMHHLSICSKQKREDSNLRSIPRRIRSATALATCILFCIINQRVGFEPTWPQKVHLPQT